MRTIHLPIEPLEERYSIQWHKWFNLYWTGDAKFVFGETMTNKITVGSFLDVYGTCYHKASQMQSCVDLIRKSNFRAPDDWIFLHDLWNPDLAHLAYIRSGADCQFKIAGCLHAGCWDDHDFLTKKGMRRWALGLEQSILEIPDLIFVATNFHKELICKYADTFHLSGIREKIRVTGFPLYTNAAVGSRSPNKRDMHLVVFPHRLDAEKQPNRFDDLAAYLSKELPNDFRFLKTKDVCKTKEGYYDLLNHAGFALSFALQETWGIAMQEAVLAGCIPIVPDRLSYTEMYLKEFRYTCECQIGSMIRQVLEGEEKQKELKELLETQRRLFIKAGSKAIPNMQREMQCYGC